MQRNKDKLFIGAKQWTNKETDKQTNISIHQKILMKKATTEDECLCFQCKAIF